MLSECSHLISCLLPWARCRPRARARGLQCQGHLLHSHLCHTTDGDTRHRLEMPAPHQQHGDTHEAATPGGRHHHVCVAVFFERGGFPRWAVAGWPCQTCPRVTPSLGTPGCASLCAWARISVSSTKDLLVPRPPLACSPAKPATGRADSQEMPLQQTGGTGAGAHQQCHPQPSSL